jgi:rare lipoprotein A
MHQLTQSKLPARELRRHLHRLLRLAFSIALWGALGAGCGTYRASGGAVSQVDPKGKSHDLSGKASWYGDRFQGRKTASGEPFDMNALTAAHKTLPFGTVVEVTRPDSGQVVKVRITDRGPFVKGRVIDLSRAAAQQLGMIRAGVVPVQLKIVQWGERARR